MRTFILCVYIYGRGDEVEFEEDNEDGEDEDEEVNKNFPAGFFEGQTKDLRECQPPARSASSFTAHTPPSEDLVDDSCCSDEYTTYLSGNYQLGMGCNPFGTIKLGIATSDDNAEARRLENKRQGGMAASFRDPVPHVQAKVVVGKSITRAFREKHLTIFTFEAVIKAYLSIDK